MHPRLLDYFNQELQYMRDSAVEFARAHPDVAAHLDLGAHGVADPYVERLIEAFCLLSARTRIKLDAEFPRLAQRLLEVLHPGFVAPVPSMGVARLEPDASCEELGEGLRVPAQTALWSHIAEHAQTPVQWRTTRDLTLWPLRVAQAELLPLIPGVLAGAAARIAGRARACLRLRLSSVSPWSLGGLRGLDALPMHLCGDPCMASRLFELLHAGFVACALSSPGSPAEARSVGSASVRHDGLDCARGLLPRRFNTVHAHCLLQEYFHAPACLHEFTLAGLGGELAGMPGTEVDLWLLLREAPQDLCTWARAEHFALFGVPVINLFETRTDRLRLIPERTEFQVVVDRARPLDHEVWSIDELQLHHRSSGLCETFRPLYQTLRRDGADHGRYFSLRREPRVLSQAARRWGSRAPYVGTEVFVSLVDQFDAPYAVDAEQASVKAWCSNRDLPLWLGHGLAGAHGLGVTARGVAAAQLLGAPAPPRPPLALEHGAWNLIRLLAAHHLPLAELDSADAALAMREWLSLFAPAGDDVTSRHVDGLVRARLRAATRRLPHPGPQVFGRTLQYQLEFDEDAFAPGSPLLLGMVLDRVLHHYAPINNGSQITLQSAQRGELWCGPVRMGERGAA